MIEDVGHDLDKHDTGFLLTLGAGSIFGGKDAYQLHTRIHGEHRCLSVDGPEAVRMLRFLADRIERRAQAS